MDKFSRRALLRISTHSYFSYDCRVSSIRSQAFIQCSAISLEYFSPSDSVVHTFESRQRRRHFRWGVAARRQQRERERESALVKNFSRYSFEMHSVKVRCERVKRENSGKKKTDFPLFLSLARRDDELDYGARHLRVSSLSFGCARFRPMEIFFP